MTKYILPFSGWLYVISERGFLNANGEWVDSMDAATHFMTTATALDALDRIGENYNVIVCQ